MTDGNRAESSVELPRDHEVFGTIPNIRLPDNGLPEAGGQLEKHVCRLADAEPLCGASVPEDAPVFPFRGQRDQIAKGLARCCEECRRELETITNAARDLWGVEV